MECCYSSATTQTSTRSNEIEGKCGMLLTLSISPVFGISFFSGMLSSILLTSNHVYSEFLQFERNCGRVMTDERSKETLKTKLFYQEK